MTYSYVGTSGDELYGPSALPAPTAAGSYTVTATVNDANYTGSATGTLVIAKATATVTLGGLAQTYSGSALAATATTTPSGLTVTYSYVGTSGTTYGPSATAPTAAGSYAVTATVNDANYAGSATGTLVIAKATATVTLGGLAQTYSGSALAASTATTTPSGLTVTYSYVGTGGTTYGPSATAPTAAGSYTVTATVNDANYAGSATGTLVIAKATATVTLGGLAQTYSGSALAATATTTPSGLTVTYSYVGTSETATVRRRRPRRRRAATRSRRRSTTRTTRARRRARCD